jgi:hypothetical protein
MLAMGKLMRKIFRFSILGFLFFLVTACASSSSSKDASLQLSFQLGTNLGAYVDVDAHKNIYVAWIENSSGTFIQNLAICKKLLDGSITGTYVLPYWKTNVYPKSDTTEVDAVTSATLTNQDFTLTARSLKDTNQRKFTVYFEIDRSRDPNDWFTNQPALLYSAAVNLDDSSTTEYTLSPVGWTRDIDTSTSTDYNENVDTSGDPPTVALGTLQTELRYITDTKPFGTADSDSAENMVKSVVLTIQ